MCSGTLNHYEQTATSSYLIAWARGKKCDLETARDIVATCRRCGDMEPEAPHEVRGAMDGSGFIERRSMLHCLLGSSSRLAWSDIFLDMAAFSYRGANSMDRKVLP